MLRRSVLLLAALAFLTVAGCGGGGDKTFDVASIGITFKHPAKFKPITNVKFGQQAGAKPTARAGVALDDVNAIIVSRYALKVTINQNNITRYKSEIDKVIGSLAGKSVSGRAVEYGGLPGYEYVISLNEPPNGQSRMTVLFDQATEYLINCQSTPGKRNDVEAACRQALDSLRRR